MPENPITDLKWYAANGVDLAVEDEPIDQFAASKPPARPASVPVAPVLSAAPALGNEPETVREAEELAAGAENLDALRERFDRFSGCPLKLRATQLVFADGNPEGRVMFIGEAPGADEDIQGKPFVGRAGRLLDRMLAAIDLDRSKVYIANTVPWRPPGNRTPTPQETATCRPFIERQIALCDPDFLICMGAPAAAELMGNRQGILKFRGRWHEFDTGARKIRAMATLHPAYLLRQPLQKRLAWRDFLALKEALEG